MRYKSAEGIWMRVGSSKTEYRRDEERCRACVGFLPRVEQIEMKAALCLSDAALIMAPLISASQS